MIPNKKTVLDNSFVEVKLPKFLNATRQKTLKSKITFTGIGLHTGNKVKMTLNPAPIETGIVFRKQIEGKTEEIKANYKNVVSTRLCTVLSDINGNSVSTVEHILSALYAYEIDNVFIDINSNEIPVYDGSSLEFVKMIEKASFEEQKSHKKFLKIKKNVEVKIDNKISRVSPFDNTLITTEVNYNHKVIGKQSISLVLNPNIYKSQIASARTFGFLKDVENLRKSGLALGGSLENAIVLDEEEVLNEEGLRFTDEFVRHKLLDFIGDISLSGYRILGSFYTSHPGHELNLELLKKIFESQDNWELVCSN
ncbi:MAG: UDP-3-O-[3-hydroxymyristoyl] N-acetylglucosamine deacetylase [Pelagibacteraceae bacterium TMED65]|nr:UDP-3-O-[3-hydroxymyristoyl] N-acetylglucosamine deacetylase [Rickettsiales bacterium]OUU51060.1 MAG: UDP-3-O-[3-hydroxymyristoyl] N-acetylglucosamine deacetylase [Pelagibacteraceae bacterium TMED65]|tara:strand:- start:788 stop:1717 length:930 start_codon:yes stop_codon:yes gene_type:complete